MLTLVTLVTAVTAVTALTGNLVLVRTIYIVIVSIMQISVGEGYQKLTLNQFDSKIENGGIEKITCTGHENSNCYGTLIDGGSFSVILPELSTYEERLKIYNFTYEAPTPGFFDYFVNLAPWLLIIGFWFFIMRRMRDSGAGGGGIFNFAKSKAKIVSPENPIIADLDGRLDIFFGPAKVNSDNIGRRIKVTSSSKLLNLALIAWDPKKMVSFFPLKLRIFSVNICPLSGSAHSWASSIAIKSKS